jgi:SAM-dependent methyltransferase
MLETVHGIWKQIDKRTLQEARRTTPTVTIDGVAVSLEPKKPTSWGPPEEYSPERYTLWSFPDRGEWATHRGNYRGNWSPYIPRNLLLKYTQPGEMVLDPMVGSGTTLVECKLLGRNGIGLDVNPDAALVAAARLDFELPKDLANDARQQVHVGDARDLSPLADASVDLVATHPPYANIIKFTHRDTDRDLSHLSYPDFLSAMRTAAQECYRVLKPGKYAAILVGDTRKHKHYVPVSLGVLSSFLEAGFLLKEDIIKAQHKMKGTREGWRGEYDFYLLAHEHLYVLRKPDLEEDVRRFEWSGKWW